MARKISSDKAASKAEFMPTDETREDLLAELFYSLPYGRCMGKDCGCQRFQIHRNDFPATESCNGCFHNASFHLLGSESERVYGMRWRQNVWAYADLLERGISMQQLDPAVTHDDSGISVAAGSQSPPETSALAEKVDPSREANSPERTGRAAVHQPEVSPDHSPNDAEAPSEPQNSFHMHHDSVQTVEPFELSDGSPLSSRAVSRKRESSPPQETHAGDGHVPDRDMPSRNSLRTPPLEQMKAVLEVLGVDVGQGMEAETEVEGQSSEHGHNEDATDPEQGADTEGNEALRPATDEARIQAPGQIFEASEEASSAVSPVSATVSALGFQSVYQAASIPLPMSSTSTSETRSVIHNGKVLTDTTHRERQQLNEENKCYHCKRPGHYSRNCPELGLHTYSTRNPPSVTSYGERGTTQTDTTRQEREELMRQGICFRCKKGKHLARECPEQATRVTSKLDTNSIPGSRSRGDVGDSAHTLTVQQGPAAHDLAGLVSPEPEPTERIESPPLEEQPLVQIWEPEEKQPPKQPTNGTEPPQYVPWWQQEVSTPTDNPGESSWDLESENPSSYYTNGEPNHGTDTNANSPPNFIDMEQTDQFNAERQPPTHTEEGLSPKQYFKKHGRWPPETARERAERRTRAKLREQNSEGTAGFSGRPAHVVGKSIRNTKQTQTTSSRPGTMNGSGGSSASSKFDGRTTGAVQGVPYQGSQNTRKRSEQRQRARARAEAAATTKRSSCYTSDQSKHETVILGPNHRKDDPPPARRELLIEF